MRRCLLTPKHTSHSRHRHFLVRHDLPNLMWVTFDDMHDIHDIQHWTRLSIGSQWRTDLARESRAASCAGQMRLGVRRLHRVLTKSLSAPRLPSLWCTSFLASAAASRLMPAPREPRTIVRMKGLGYIYTAVLTLIASTTTMMQDTYHRIHVRAEAEVSFVDADRV